MIVEIRIEGKPVPFTTGDHLYLVGVDSGGTEFVIRGGPEFDSLIVFGNIVTENGISMIDPTNGDNNSEDLRPLDERDDRGSSVLDLGGRDANDVWQIMLQQVQQIEEYQIDYHLLGSNSNSNH